MRHKIIIGVLVLALAFSLGFNVYYYSAMVTKQAMINDMRGHITVAWARQMSVVSYYLQNATTNIDVHGVNALLRATYSTGSSAYVPDGDLYFQMAFTPNWVSDKLGPYSEGSPTFVKHINSTAIEMIKNLAQRISDTARLILNLDIALTRREGGDPIQLLKEEGVLDSVINGCVDIRNLSTQIHDFNPKFQ